MDLISIKNNYRNKLKVSLHLRIDINEPEIINPTSGHPYKLNEIKLPLKKKLTAHEDYLGGNFMLVFGG